MIVTTAQPEDLREIAQVHVATWQAAYAGILPADYLASLSVDQREASWRQVLAEGQSELLVAKSGSGVIGFSSFGPSRDADAPPRRGELWAIYVSPDAWSTGAGRALWLATGERLATLGCDSASLWVIAGNERAIRFYTAAGFAIEAGSDKEFELGGRALREVRMVRRIGPANFSAWHGRGRCWASARATSGKS